MPVLSFEFIPDLIRDQKTSRLAAVYRPYIDVKLGNKNKWSKNFIRSLVDSGADMNVFPSSFATEVGINYKKGEERKIYGVGDQDVIVYRNITKIKINGREFETVIDFGNKVKTPLLGREGFFNYFERVTFNVKRRFFELKY